MHKHHIVPKHAGGTDDPSNIIKLTIEEHAEAHRKLFEQYGRWQDEVAWKGLLKTIKDEDMNRTISRLANLGNKNRLGSRPSDETRSKMRSSHLGQKSRLGIPCSEETKLKIGSKNKGRIQSEEEKIRRSNSCKERYFEFPMTKERKSKISTALKGKPKSEQHKQALRDAKKRKRHNE